jgi:phospholipid/cholesterol/gamma-HCH transport system ATP-binding protein
MKTKNTTDEPVIVINDVYKSFDGFDVLKGINLTVAKGENVAVLGKSGSGKSVTIKMLVGLLTPDRGTVTVLGNDIASLKEKELNLLRMRIGFSFQSSALYDSMSIKQNIAFPLAMNSKTKLTKAEINKAVEEALDAVGLRDKIDEMPSDLSGGQRKRIGIARTLILHPEIMLYDEPTSGLDPITSGEINKLIKDVQQHYNTTSIIITHDLTCARETSNRVAMLLEGKFTSVGTFDEVFKTEDEQIKNFYHYNFIQ